MSLPVLTRAQILAAQDRRREFVEVPEWSGGVWVQSISGIERDRWDMTFVRERERGAGSHRVNLRAVLITMSAVDAEGQRLFSEEDVVALGEKDAVPLDRVFEVAMRISRLRKEDVDDLGKDSTSRQNGSSGST